MVCKESKMRKIVHKNPTKSATVLMQYQEAPSYKGC